MSLFSGIYGIPIRWYKDEIFVKLDQALKNSLSLTAIESSVNTTTEINLALQTSRNFQNTNYQASVKQIAPQRNRFGVAFSTAKTAINIALETKKEIESGEIQNKDSIKTLQQHLIDQTNDPHITKIRGAPSKKRIRSAIKMSKRKTAVQEITSQVSNMQESCTAETSLGPQCKCLLCGQLGYYQKKCPSAKEN
ncbi:hypothetical protein C2G38_2183348 [Gigaspora rosea]|uniref:CCHC-type domain-containing protein n=1 Tax=Gigaspora rosea TaxID=44941 RepID=A0A397VD54_9GLOM|nr:hypothetical protein C2G38_2183348 [Gigaspora rosea]